MAYARTTNKMYFSKAVLSDTIFHISFMLLNLIIFYCEIIYMYSSVTFLIKETNNWQNVGKISIINWIVKYIFFLGLVSKNFQFWFQYFLYFYFEQFINCRPQTYLDDFEFTWEEFYYCMTSIVPWYSIGYDFQLKINLETRV